MGYLFNHVLKFYNDYPISPDDLWGWRRSGTALDLADMEGADVSPLLNQTITNSNWIKLIPNLAKFKIHVSQSVIDSSAALTLDSLVCTGHRHDNVAACRHCHDYVAACLLGSTTGV